MTLSVELDPYWTERTEWTYAFVKLDRPADLKNIEEKCYNPVRFRGKMFKKVAN